MSRLSPALLALALVSFPSLADKPGRTINAKTADQILTPATWR